MARALADEKQSTRLVAPTRQHRPDRRATRQVRCRADPRTRGGGHVPWICAINIEEVLRGAFAHEEDAIRRFVSALRLAPIGRIEAERAGRWRRRYAEQGQTLSQSDCLIAAAAVGVGVSVATANPRHFPMAEVDIQHWHVGE